MSPCILLSPSPTDFVVVMENPLQNLSVLRGTGVIRLNDETGEVERVGGVVYTIKDGIVYDAKKLLRDVREMVQVDKDRLGIAPGPMPIETVPYDEEKMKTRKAAHG